jgi:hypothetical protein
VLRLCTMDPRTTEEDVAKTAEARHGHGRAESGYMFASRYPAIRPRSKQNMEIASYTPIPQDQSAP